MLNADSSRDRLRSVFPVRRSASPAVATRIQSTSERPSFQRRLTERSTTPAPSLLTASLKHHTSSPVEGNTAALVRPHTTSTASSDNELSHLDLYRRPEAICSNELAPTSPKHSPEHSGQESNASQSTVIALPKRKRGVRQAGSPYSPSTSLGDSSSLSARRRSGVESEPEDGKLAADSTFLELLQATKPFLSLASGAALTSRPNNLVRDTATPSSAKDSPIVPVSALHQRSPDHEQPLSSPSLYEKDIPTSFAAIGIDY